MSRGSTAGESLAEISEAAMVRRIFLISVLLVFLCAMLAALSGCPGGGGGGDNGGTSSGGGPGKGGGKAVNVEPVALDKFVPRQDFWRPDGVEWRNFDAALFEQAAAEEKPIFMVEADGTSIPTKMYAERIFAEEGIKEILAEKYLCVWADRDRYPGLFERYQANNSETPAVLIIHPRGPQLLSRTREDPDRVVDWLHIFIERWEKEEDRQKYEEIADTAMEGFVAVTDAKADAFKQAVAQNAPADSYDKVLAEIVRTFNKTTGDFIKEPRFPRVEAMEFLTDAAMRDNADAADILKEYIDKTLLMLRDQVDGGFFELSYNSSFSDLDFTKRLDTNARIVSELSRLYVMTGEPKYKGAAKNALDFMLKFLAHNVDGRVVGFGSRMENVPDYYTADKSKRMGIVAPDMEPTIIAEYNFIAVEALVWAHFVIDDGAGYLDMAKSVANNLIEHMYKDKLFARYASADTGTPKFLADQTWAARALITLYMATGVNKYIDTARETMTGVRENFWAENGGLLDTPADGPGLYSIPFWPMGYAAIASRAEVILYQMSKETGVEGSGKEHLEIAREYIAGYAQAYLPQVGVADQSMVYALAARENTSEPLDFHMLFSGANEGEAAAAVKEAFVCKFPFRSIEQLAAGEDDARIGQLGYTTTVPVSVFLCYGPQCVPVKPGEVESKVDHLKRRMAGEGLVFAAAEAESETGTAADEGEESGGESAEGGQGE